MNITSYLVFNGEAEQAANFYADLLGGKIENLYRYDSMPTGPGAPEIPDNYKQKILHCCILFPGGSLSAADTLPSDSRNFGNGGHMLTLTCDSIEQVERVYGKLCAGSQKIQCKLGEAFFAKRYAEVVDQFGVLWALLYEEN